MWDFLSLGMLTSHSHSHPPSRRSVIITSHGCFNECLCLFNFFFVFAFMNMMMRIAFFFSSHSRCFRYDSTIISAIPSAKQQMCIYVLCVHYTYFIGIEKKKKKQLKWNRKEKLNSKQHNKILLKWHRRRHRSQQRSMAVPEIDLIKIVFRVFYWWVSFENCKYSVF